MAPPPHPPNAAPVHLARPPQGAHVPPCSVAPVLHSDTPYIGESKERKREERKDSLELTVHSTSRDDPPLSHGTVFRRPVGE